jgi:hypothetical protein
VANHNGSFGIAGARENVVLTAGTECDIGMSLWSKSLCHVVFLSIFVFNDSQIISLADHTPIMGGETNCWKNN